MSLVYYDHLNNAACPLCNASRQAIIGTSCDSGHKKMWPERKNGKLVKKKGKFGRFYGCTNFPVCKYSHSLYKNTTFVCGDTKGN